MTFILGLACVVLIAVVVIQIGKVTELASAVRGEEEAQDSVNGRTAPLMLVFVVLFLIYCIWSAIDYSPYMLGYGPHESASAHGGRLDSMFNITLFFTGIVFVITQFALFYFAWKYRGRSEGKAVYLPHDNRLEIVWTAIPAVVMTFLVVGGLDAWNEVMADVNDDEEFMEIEATGYQFAWHLRYPGADGKLGARNYKLIDATNPVGQDWNDTKNLDDLHPAEIVLPVNKKVRVRITSRDVLHNFYLPHFRVKMDAVPGMPTYFVFTPTKTTEEYRQQLRAYDEYQAPTDPTDPESEPLWKTFNYELACAELCGSGHYSMRRVVRIVSEEEYQDWLSQQESYYLSSIRNTDKDPFKGQLLDVEISQRKESFNTSVDEARALPDSVARIIELQYVNFETGSAVLTSNSKYELENLKEVMNKYPTMTIELGGHTDNTGDAAANQSLSQARANAVFDFLNANGIDPERLSAVGYGQSRPIDSNDTEEGRANNRRTELKITNL
ncbi:MAG: OmpA family protein [Phaeodactylibacter sp.]|nr:OmpA family protein [Phaeodactylibacter sp.]